MGSIVYTALIRTAFAIAIIWYLNNTYETRFIWLIAAALIYLLVVQPAIFQYKKFQEEKVNKMEGTLCATCKHYDPTAVLCLKYDQHPNQDFIPCQGNDWEPK